MKNKIILSLLTLNTSSLFCAHAQRDDAAFENMRNQLIDRARTGHFIRQGDRVSITLAGETKQLTLGNEDTQEAVIQEFIIRIDQDAAFPTDIILRIFTKDTQHMFRKKDTDLKKNHPCLFWIRLQPHHQAAGNRNENNHFNYAFDDDSGDDGDEDN